MKLDEVPQDDSKSFEGQRKRLYARNADGIVLGDFVQFHG